jgi:hypothetical protein
MSHALEAVPPSPVHLLEGESYLLSDPRDPARVTASRELSVVLTNRARAYKEFFQSNAVVAGEAFGRLLPEACVKLLAAAGVQVADADAVKGYLLRRPDLTPVVWAVASRAKARCGNGDQVALDLYRDPEIEQEHLVIYLRFQEYGEEAMRTLRGLGEEAAVLLRRVAGWLLVTTDFRTPRG